MLAEFRQKYQWKPWREDSFLLYEKAKVDIEKALTGVNHSIYFFGSSSIKGVGGKGFIDIYISTEDKELVKFHLTAIGYEYKASAGNQERLFLQKYARQDTDLLAFHIHVSSFGNKNLVESIAFRDYLRENDIDAHTYSEIKKKASKEAMKQSDKDSAKKIYMETKNPVVHKIMLSVRDYINKNSDRYSNL